MSLQLAGLALFVLACTAGVADAADYPPMVTGADQTRIIYPDGPAELLVTGQETAGTLGMIVHYDLPGEGTPEQVDQPTGAAFYVLAGQYRFTIGDASHDLGAGGVVVLPPKQLFSFVNTGTSVGRLLLVSSPAGSEDFFIQAADQNHKSAEGFAELNHKYGISR